jgi:hypothetical protein
VWDLELSTDGSSYLSYCGCFILTHLNEEAIECSNTGAAFVMDYLIARKTKYGYNSEGHYLDKREKLGGIL